MPKIDLDALPSITGTSYPHPFDRIVTGRSRKVLGDAAGLSQFGVNMTRLKPGAGSSHRHWHACEDEFIYVISGEATLIEDSGETVMRAGDAAAFKAGVLIGHHLVNRSGEDVVYLEVGTRSEEDVSTYSDPEIDLKMIKSGGAWKPHHKNGDPY